MTTKQTSDQQLKDNVTTLNVTMEQVVKPALVRIENTLATQSYVSQATYADAMVAQAAENIRIDTKVDAAMAEAIKARPVVKTYGILSNRILQLIIVGVLAFILYSLFKQVPSWIGVS